MNLNKYLLAFAFVTAILGGATLYLFSIKDAKNKKTNAKISTTGNAGPSLTRPTDLGLYAKSIKRYAKTHSFDTSTFLLADMGLPSGKKRFFVYDLKKLRVKYSGLVAHGSGKTRTETTVFSNTPNSWCSSMGKYRIANKYNGRFGTAYKLIGLDSTNRNAFVRAIVLHAYECVPDTEVFPQTICNSLGCPMVSVNFLKTLDLEIQQSKKPLLLWIVK